MISKIKTTLASPVFDDEEKSRIAQLINIISLFAIVFLTLLAISNLVNKEAGTTLAGIGSLATLMFVVQFIMRRGHVKVAAILLVAVSWIVLALLAWTGAGIRDTNFWRYGVVILLASLLIGWRTGLIVAGLTILYGWWLAYAEFWNLTVFTVDELPDTVLDTTVIFAMFAIILSLATVSLQNALKRARRQERSLEKSNRELQTMSDSLENRVAERTRGLELVAVLSEELIGILNVEELLARLVNRLKSNFRYAYVLVYLFDEERARLVLTAGSGSEGKQLKARGHYILPDEDSSAVARAARSHRTVKIDNVHQVESRLSTSVLPNTHAEMAMPIILDGQVVGVLNVQRSEVGAIDAADINLLRPLVNQASIAIRNARLFQQVEMALSEAYEIQNRYTEQAWDQVKMVQMGGEHHYIPAGGPSPANLPPALLDETLQEAAGKRSPVIATLDDDSGKQAVVAPVTLRDDVIGSLQIQSGQERQWSAEDLQIIEAVIEQMGQTVDNLRLFDETRERAAREQVIREITDKMRAANSLEALTKIAAQELGRHLSATHAELELGLMPKSDGK